MSPRTVLYVDHVSQLSGGERSLAELARALDRDRFLPVLAVPREGPLCDAFRAMGAPVHAVGGDPALFEISRMRLDTSFSTGLRWIPGTIAVARRVAAVARTSDADLISSNSLKAHVLGSLAAWMTGLPLVWHLRDCLEPSWPARALGLLARLSARRVIAISDAVVRSLAEVGTFPMDRVVRVHNGLDSAPGRPVLRRELALPDSVTLVGAVGQIAQWKGLHVLLEAVAGLPGVHVAIAGACLFAENEAAYYEGLQARARAADLAGRVHFLGPREDVPDVMASLDVFVHAAIRPEPFGRVLVEAMAAARPVLASAIGAVPEVLGDAGVLCPPGDVRALAGGIAALAADPLRRARLGAAGAARSRAEFSLAACRRGVEAVYAEVLGGAR